VGKNNPKFWTKSQNVRTHFNFDFSLGAFFKMQFFHFFCAATHENEFLGRKNGRKLPYFMVMFLEIASFTSLSDSYLPVAKFG
jgi:hypothetical protein